MSMIATRPTPIWNVPPRMTDLVARPAPLARIRGQLAHGPVALVGERGSGKSWLAVEYAYRFGPSYQVAWWLDGSRLDQGEQLRELFRQAGLVAPVRPARAAQVTLRSYLRRLPPGSSLLIYDNVVDAAQVRAWLPGTGHVLITSRCPSWTETAATVNVTTALIADPGEHLRDRVVRDHVAAG